jgi:ATP-binding cassette subfamily C protein LapB
MSDKKASNQTAEFTVPAGDELRDLSFRHDPLLAAMVVITRLYHRELTPESLVAGLPLNGEPLTPELLPRVAERAGLKAKFKRRKLSELNKLVLPAILILKDRQAVVLTSIDHEKGEVELIIPELEEGARRFPLDELEEQYLGYAVLFSEQFTPKQKPASDIAHYDGHWFWSTLWQNKGIYRDVIIASIVINIFVVANPLFIKNVYDRIVPNNAIESLWMLAIGVSAMYLFDYLLKYLRSYFLEIAGKKSDILMSARLFEQTLGLQMREKPDRVGVFANHLKEFDSIRNFFTSGTIASLVDLPFAILFIVVIYWIAGPLAYVPAFIIVLVLLYSLLMRRPIQRAIEASYAASAQKHAVLIETLNALETVKALGLEAQSQWKWEQAVGEIAKASLRAKMLQSSVGRFTGLMQQLSTILVIVVGVYLIKDNEVTMGALIASVMLAQRAIGPMGQVANLITSYMQTKTALQQLNELMKKPVERTKAHQFIHLSSVKGKVEFEHVKFAYPNDNKLALDDVSFVIQPGERVGIIGRIGSGKSTIAKLILKLYEPTEGMVRIDDIDIHQIDPAELRRFINYLPQDIQLFKGTVWENIAYRAPYISDERVLEAARIAGVDDFIRQHPSGYHLDISEGGSSLSGGQKQSIAIARALLLDSPIYILDEPTNAMDARTEQQFLRRMQDRIRGRTLLVITHKTSLLSLVDRLIVMEKGRVIADGPKEAILETLKARSQGGAS